MEKLEKENYFILFLLFLFECLSIWAIYLVKRIWVALVIMTCMYWMAYVTAGYISNSEIKHEQKNS